MSEMKAKAINAGAQLRLNGVSGSLVAHLFADDTIACRDLCTRNLRGQ